VPKDGGGSVPPRRYVFRREVGNDLNWKPRGAFAWQTQPVNPAAAWATILSPDPVFGPDVIFARCAQAPGVLDHAAEEAEERERRRLHRTRSLLARVPVGRLWRHVPAVVKWAGGIAAPVMAAVLVYWLGLS
jgi:hypothetical protein